MMSIFPGEQDQTVNRFMVPAQQEVRFEHTYTQAKKKKKKKKKNKKLFFSQLKKHYEVVVETVER